MTKHKFILRWAPWIIILVGVAAIGTAIYLAWPQRADISLNIPTAKATGSLPVSAVKPDQKTVQAYTVPALNPKYIQIPTIGVNQTRVISLGLTKSNAIDVPKTAYDAGWYNAGAKPGQKGAMFIYAHVAGYSVNVDGIFHNLHKLAAGDKITVTRGDNKTYTYIVNATKVYQDDKVDMRAVLNPYKPDTAALNLMTCTGTYDAKTETFSQRLVVFSTLSS